MSRMFGRCAALVALVLGLVVGPGSCGGDSASDFIAAYCDLAKPCCASPGLPASGEKCRALLGAFAPASQYDSQAGKACLSELRVASGKPSFCQTVSTQDGPSCDLVFGGSEGSKAPGEPCTDDDECKASAEGRVRCQSRSTGGAQIRKCQVQVRGKQGDAPCVGTVDGSVTYGFGSATTTDIPPRGYLCHLSDGLRCDATTGACVTRKAVGEACTSTQECVATGYCDRTLRRCADRKALGQPCTASFSSDECVTAAYCRSSDRTCVAKGAEGVSCTDDLQCLSEDCVNGKCDKGTTGDLGLALICGQ
jgi:hypothetical protein